ncbi:hypothetical protein HZC32_02140, partial [Candidatus Woesearchaeota archaeon]|nr:hypothetical protein [Candidatus Woesearchaeota archaeon]
KGFEFLEEKLGLFGIKKSGWEWDKKQKAVLYFLLGRERLPKHEIRVGPPLSMTEYVANFKKKNKNNFEQKGRIYARVKVEHPQLEELVKNAVKQKYFVEKTKKVRIHFQK